METITDSGIIFADFTYLATEIECLNCGKVDSYKLGKGTPVSQAACSYCGCTGVLRRMKKDV